MSFMTSLMVFFFVIIFLVITLVLLFFPMERFFKDFPKPNDWFKKEQLYLNVYAVHFFKDVKIISKEFSGFLILGYLKVRLLALKEDIRTDGESFGISWGLQKMKEEN